MSGLKAFLCRHKWKVTLATIGTGLYIGKGVRPAASVLLLGFSDSPAEDALAIEPLRTI